MLNSGPCFHYRFCAVQTGDASFVALVFEPSAQKSLACTLLLARYETAHVGRTPLTGSAMSRSAISQK